MALYECDGHTTHPGDVGFGLETDVDEVAARMREQGGDIFLGPTPESEGGHRIAIGMLPDRHFFELVDPD
jgi:predicted enzyme related to lactoylglutathione lyase